MKPKTKPARTYHDLMEVTGLGRDAVKLAIRAGQLPGYAVGPKPMYVVPAEAFDAFCAGTWEPRPMKQPEPIRPLQMIGQRKVS